LSLDEGKWSVSRSGRLTSRKIIAHGTHWRRVWIGRKTETDIEKRTYLSLAREYLSLTRTYLSLAREYPSLTRTYLSLVRVSVPDENVSVPGEKVSVPDDN
jgi:hypothetical protein